MNDAAKGLEDAIKKSRTGTLLNDSPQYRSQVVSPDYKGIMLKMLALIESLDTEGKLSDLGEIRKEIDSL